MAIIVASMMVIVFTAVGILGFVCALHMASTSPWFRLQLRRLIFACAVKMFAARRAATYKLAPLVTRVEGRLRARANAPVEMENAGQQ
jgi:hypothetical protein